MNNLDILSDGIEVFRGTTSKNLPRRYPGTFYTEDELHAKKYAKEGGTVRKTIINPKNYLDIEFFNDESFRQKMEEEFEKFIGEVYKSPAFHASDTQFYDNIYDGVTDFSYPTDVDNKFLKYLGYDAVYFYQEGGNPVRTWYMPD